jgi:solute carrier family 25 carnitine/acylcarnitine transporter 20/29
MDTFIAGFAYGATSVIVGQPLDTIKTRMQASQAPINLTSWSVFREIYTKEGIKGLYRGGGVLFVGGGLIRSAQFGVYNNSIAWLRSTFGSTLPEERWLKIFDPQVIVSGFLGGCGRALVESPFEYLKTRRQVGNTWKFSELMSGSGATLLRNSILFSSFVIYIDLSKQIVEGGLSPFLSGAICANLAWLTIWPLDVIKSQVQSGRFQGYSLKQLLLENFRTGAFFRGIVPGLSRSFISNGCSMVVYNKVLTLLESSSKL